MALSEYPVDLRADRPERSSRLWAVLTIILVKFLAVIPHLFVLIFLGIAQWIVAFVAQFVVAVRGEYPPGMFHFVVGVLRWSTRVSAFILSLSDRYPPFTLEPDPGYPIDVVVERPARHSRLYALFTVIVEILFIAGGITLAVVLVRHAASSGTSSTSNWQGQSWTPSFGTGLFLRQIAALPHYIVLIALGIVAFVIWLVVQWVILFTASYPRGMYELSSGVVRWQVRVQAYALGLVERYPPFSFEQSVAAGPATAGVAPAGAPYAPAAVSYPAGAPPMPAATSYAPAPTPTPPAPAAIPSAPVPPPSTAVPAGWYPDPAGRHELRYWDGSAWTPSVSDGGAVSADPP